MAQRARKVKILPFPGAVLAGKWEIKEGRQAFHGECMLGAKGYREHRLTVPMGGTEFEFLVRTHEMAHVRLSPMKAPKEHTEAFVALEEVRVNVVGEGLTGAKLTASMDHAPESFKKFVLAGDVRMGLTLEEMPLREVALRYLQAGPESGVGEKIFGVMQERLDDSQRKYLKHFLSDVLSYWRRNGVRAKSSVLRDLAKQFDAVFPKMRDAVFDSCGIPDLSKLDGMWGTMTVEEAKLTAMKMTPVKRKVSADAGNVPSRMHRMTIDQCVFDRKAKRMKGGTVLVDVSGSMTWGMEALEKVVKQSPGNTVAMYAGTSSTGKVVIVGKGGKMATLEEIKMWRANVGGGNIIDGPALAWLGTMPEPRVWVSDGHVTGKEEVHTKSLITEAEQLTEKYRIRRVEKAEDVMK